MVAERLDSIRRTSPWRALPNDNLIEAREALQVAVDGLRRIRMAKENAEQEERKLLEQKSAKP